jgi:hypothetical protein
MMRVAMLLFTPVETARTRPAACVRARFAFHGLIPSSTRAAALLGLVLASACGRPSTDQAAQPRRIDDPAELESIPEPKPAKRKRQWRRQAAPSPMPETFVAFELPDLAKLDGAWLVESEVSDRRVLWLIDEGGANLTEIDHRGVERVYSMSLGSPCGLRLTDEEGHTRTRSLAVHGEQLVITRSGATAVRGQDGTILACIGHRTYQIAPDGRCRYTSEMLGTWSEQVTSDERCELGKDATGPLLTVAEHHLRERNGVWLDESSANALAIAVADREAGLAALASEDAVPLSEAAAPSETPDAAAPAAPAPAPAP